MTKTICKIGNSHGIMLDAAFMDLARLHVGDQISITLHEGGSIVLTPVRQAIEPKKAASVARRIIRKNSSLFRRLA